MIMTVPYIWIKCDNLQALLHDLIWFSEMFHLNCGLLTKTTACWLAGWFSLLFFVSFRFVLFFEPPNQGYRSPEGKPQ